MPAPGWTHADPNGRTGPHGSTVDTAAVTGPLWTTTALVHGNPPTRRSDRDVRRRIVTIRHKFSHRVHSHASGKGLIRQKSGARPSFRGTTRRRRHHNREGV